MASRRRYLSQAELAQFADITITDATEADDQISMAEELIDSYIGFQEKSFPYDLQERLFAGLAAGAGATSLTVQSNQANIYDVDYFKFCEVEILGGTGNGQRRTVTGSTKAGVLTVATWDTTPSTDSFYRIYQLGKFPRLRDMFFDNINTPYTYYKAIPEAVKRATAAQVEFIVYMGADFFRTDKSELQSESIGDYSYSRNRSGGAGVANLIAPKAKMLLRGIINRTGLIT
jgi:hypothetical protein